MIILGKHGCGSRAIAPVSIPDMQRRVVRQSTWQHTHPSRVLFFFFFLGSKQGPNRMISSVLVRKSIPGRYQTTLFIVSFFCISSSSSSLCSTKLLSLSVFFLCLLIFFGSVWIGLILLKLKTYCWNHCSKIIFKCVNNTVGPIFNEKIDKKWNLWVREQCTDALFTEKSQHLRLLFIEQ